MQLATTETQTVAQRARDLVAFHSHFYGRADNFEFEYEGNVLVVRGRVPTYYLKQLLQDALKKLEGVRRVDNRVDVIFHNGTLPVPPPTSLSMSP
jgi:hypothetical protein